MNFLNKLDRIIAFIRESIDSYIEEGTVAPPENDLITEKLFESFLK